MTSLMLCGLWGKTWKIFKFDSQYFYRNYFLFFNDTTINFATYKPCNYRLVKVKITGSVEKYRDVLIVTGQAIKVDIWAGYLILYDQITTVNI